jgi:hypothetical protein
MTVTIKRPKGMAALLAIFSIITLSATCMAQAKTKFRQLKVVKFTPLITESEFTIQSETSTEPVGGGFNTGGRIVVAKNPATNKKEIVETGFLRGVGAEVKFTGSNRGDNGALPGEIVGTFKLGNNKITINGNTNGDWQSAEYAYDGTNVKVKIIGKQDGTIETGTTLKYETEVANNVSYSGGITINTSGSTITSLTAAANYNYKPVPTGGYGFTFTAANTFAFSSGDDTFWFIFGFNF